MEMEVKWATGSSPFNAKSSCEVIASVSGHPAVDTEIKAPSDENTALKGSPFKA